MTVDPLAPTPGDPVVPAPYGVYGHVPFCRSRWDYCAFATYTDRDHLMERYAAACDIVPLVSLPEASNIFASFIPLDL